MFLYKANKEGLVKVLAEVLGVRRLGRHLRVPSICLG